MKAIMVMYDSLRRDLLPCYEGPDPMDLPNFKRLAGHTVTFDKSYVCSLPCMPARRELHTGRANFLHRSWGPVEPFDDSMPELLQKAGIHSHLATDHYHYIQDGGATYCGRYSSWACYRGQESDAWIGDCTPRGEEQSPYVLLNENTPEMIKRRRQRGGWRNFANRSVLKDESHYPQAQTFADGIDFIKRNGKHGNWFLQIETFDPHEPFTSPKDFEGKWFDPDQPFLPDWPPYSPVSEDEETVENMRKKYFSLAEYCDHCLGLVLDEMDRQDLWADTMLIVNTDHGFLLNDHGWWGKGSMPDFEELVHTPLFIWDPGSKKRGERRQALVQTIDIAPTLLDFFGLEIPKDMTGRSLRQTVAEDRQVRSYGIFGYHGGPVNITDGQYVYMRAVKNENICMNEYTLMPTHMDSLFSPEEMEKAELVPPFGFTKKCPLLKIPAGNTLRLLGKLKEDVLYDLAVDKEQEHPIQEDAVKSRMLGAMAQLFKENEAPDEVYERYGLKADM